jgi:hypothetical protein
MRDVGSALGSSMVDSASAERDDTIALPKTRDAKSPKRRIASE